MDRMPLDGQRVGVVIEPGDVAFDGPEPAADDVGGLEDQHLLPGPRQVVC